MKKIALYVTSIAVVLLVGSNLRAPITALSPVLVEINTYFHLSNVQASLLTSIPLAVFALGSIAVVTMALKFGVRQLLLASVLILGQFISPSLIGMDQHQYRCCLFLCHHLVGC